DDERSSSHETIVAQLSRRNLPDFRDLAARSRLAVTTARGPAPTVESPNPTEGAGMFITKTLLLVCILAAGLLASPPAAGSRGGQRSGGPTRSMLHALHTAASALACSSVGGPDGSGSSASSAGRLTVRTTRSKSPFVVTTSQRAPSTDSTR